MKGKQLQSHLGSTIIKNTELSRKPWLWLNAEESDHSYCPRTEDHRPAHTHGGVKGKEKKTMTTEGHIGARRFILPGNGGKSSELRWLLGKKGGNWNFLSSLEEKGKRKHVSANSQNAAQFGGVTQIIDIYIYLLYITKAQSEGFCFIARKICVYKTKEQKIRKAK